MPTTQIEKSVLERRKVIFLDIEKHVLYGHQLLGAMYALYGAEHAKEILWGSKKVSDIEIYLVEAEVFFALLETRYRKLQCVRKLFRADIVEQDLLARISAEVVLKNDEIDAVIQASQV